MNVNHYIGFDVHKKSISYCVKAAGAVARRDGSHAVQRMDLR